MTPADRPARPRLADRAPDGRLDDAPDPVDETSLDSFPASDPPSWTGMQAGHPDRSLGVPETPSATPGP